MLRMFFYGFIKIMDFEHFLLFFLRIIDTILIEQAAVLRITFFRILEIIATRAWCIYSQAITP